MDTLKDSEPDFYALEVFIDPALEDQTKQVLRDLLETHGDCISAPGYIIVENPTDLGDISDTCYVPAKNLLNLLTDLTKIEGVVQVTYTRNHYWHIASDGITLQPITKE
jgi:hypothetical protein